MDSKTRLKQFGIPRFLIKQQLLLYQLLCLNFWKWNYGGAKNHVTCARTCCHMTKCLSLKKCYDCQKTKKKTNHALHWKSASDNPHTFTKQLIQTANYSNCGLEPTATTSARMRLESRLWRNRKTFCCCLPIKTSSYVFFNHHRRSSIGAFQICSLQRRKRPCSPTDFWRTWISHHGDVVGVQRFMDITACFWNVIIKTSCSKKCHWSWIRRQGCQLIKSMCNDMWNQCCSHAFPSWGFRCIDQVDHPRASMHMKRIKIQLV